MTTFYSYAWAKCDFCTKFLTKAPIGQGMVRAKIFTQLLTTLPYEKHCTHSDQPAAVGRLQKG